MWEAAAGLTGSGLTGSLPSSLPRQVLYQEGPELQPGSGLRPSITPTKKIEMDRTIMPDGTIVTTVTTIQSRPKMDCKLGERLAVPVPVACPGRADLPSWALQRSPPALDCP